MKQKAWRYVIRAGMLPVVLTAVMFAVFGGLTAWLYSTHNGACIITGAFSVILLVLLLATLWRRAFFKVLIGKDGFCYKTRPGRNLSCSYARVQKAWVSSGQAQNRAQQQFCNIQISPDLDGEHNTPQFIHLADNSR